MNAGELSEDQLDTLVGWCTNPLTDTSELAIFLRVSYSSVYRDARLLEDRGLIVGVEHGTPHLPSSLRYAPTLKGIETSAESVGLDVEGFVCKYPVSRLWLRSLLRRIDAISSIYRLAATIAKHEQVADDPVSVEILRRGPYDALITLPRSRTIGIVRLGVALTRKAWHYRLNGVSWAYVTSRRRPRSRWDEETQGKRPRDWERSYIRPGTILVLTPSSREGLMVAHYIWNLKGLRKTGYGRGRNPDRAFVGAESRDLLTSLDHPGWQSGNRLFVKDSLRSLVPLMGDDEGTVRTEDSAQHLVPKRVRLQHSATALRRKDKELLGLVADYPLATNKQLSGFRGVSPRRISNQMRGLVEGHSLVAQERHGRLKWHTLSKAGTRYQYDRDRVRKKSAERIWGIDLVPGPGDERRHRGHLLNTFLAQRDHESGLYDLVSDLAKQVREDPEFELEELLPTYRAELEITKGVTLAPDAAGTLRHGESVIPFMLEYERRARYRDALRRRIKPYDRAFRSLELVRNLKELISAILFVFPTETIEQRFIEVAFESECTLPILTSTPDTLMRHGFLGPAWQAAWEPRTIATMGGHALPDGHPLDYLRLRLADLEDYSWCFPFYRTVLNVGSVPLVDKPYVKLFPLACPA